MIALLAAACRHPAEGHDRDPAHTAEPACVSAASTGGDCDGAAAATVAVSSAATLEVVGPAKTEVGRQVACTAERVGRLSTAFAIGTDESGGESGNYGRAGVFAGDRIGRLDIDDADLAIRGSELEDGVGWRVVFPGDLDGDGDGEFLTSGLTSDRPETLVGAAFVFDGDQLGALTPEDADAHFLGGTVPDDRQAELGGATWAGDLDGDGLAEVVLGHTYMGEWEVPGFVAIHRGGSVEGEIPPAAAATRIDALDPFQATGDSMLVADVDGDGAADLVTGEYNWQGPFSRGRVLVLSGPLLGQPVRSLGEASIELVGEPPSPEGLTSSTGGALAAGDLNADGAVDLVVSAHSVDGDAGTRAGKAYVFLGPIKHGSRSVTEADLVIEGETAYAWLSLGVAILDHDGDGLDDLAVGAPSDPFFGPERPGLVYVFPGPLGPGTLDPATDAAVVYADDLPFALFGSSLAGCDLDGDGADELVIGAPWTTVDGAVRAGRAFVVPGGPWRAPAEANR